MNENSGTKTEADLQYEVASDLILLLEMHIITDVHITSHLDERGKDKTDCCSTSLKWSLDNCIPRSHIVYTDTTGILFIVR